MVAAMMGHPGNLGRRKVPHRRVERAYTLAAREDPAKLARIRWRLAARGPLPILSLMALLLSRSHPKGTCTPLPAPPSHACCAALRGLVLHRTAAHS
jgi:hypothetical protein